MGEFQVKDAILYCMMSFIQYKKGKLIEKENRNNTFQEHRLKGQD